MTCNPVTEKVSDGFKQVLEGCEDLPEECSKEPPGYQGLFWKQYPERKRETFQAGKSAKRDGVSAAKDLARTLSRMGRDHLGLWQIYDVRDEGDIRRLEAKGGALRTFYDARETGAARGVGVIGHHDPAFLLHAVTNWDVDAVLLPG